MTFSGAFKERTDSAIESHSGFLCVDADNCDEPAAYARKAGERSVCSSSVHLSHRNRL